MTNIRVHVQLKATNKTPNNDGAVSLPIKRRTLNYLAMQPGSILVCYHVPSARLLVRMVDDVLREHEHTLTNDVNQHTITVWFATALDPFFQEELSRYVTIHAKSARDSRLNFEAAPPENIVRNVETTSLDLYVPSDRRKAHGLLLDLYNRGNDAIISCNFDTFQTIIGTSSDSILPTYFAEINLALTGQKHNDERIRQGIDSINGALSRDVPSPGTMRYNLGNAWFALREYEKASDAYNAALRALDPKQSPTAVARCYKNLGSVMEKTGRTSGAKTLYARALDLDPHLPEAHLALALWYIRDGSDLASALQHLDSIVWSPDSSGASPSILGWRAETQFRLGRSVEAFRDINTLLNIGNDLDWSWPWCTKLVASYGTDTLASSELSVTFWERYTKEFSEDLRGHRAKLLCYFRIHDMGGDPKLAYEEVRQAVSDLVEYGVENPALLWDRAGHWAQREGDWKEAEKCYRKAYQLSPAAYGYCLGTALNFLKRYPEALSVLLEQAREHQPDALSWFQVAIAKEGTGDVQGCIAAYKNALQQDENYALAWFNLGGVTWNAQRKAEAISIWTEAMRRFPQHELAQQLRDDLPILRN